MVRKRRQSLHRSSDFLNPIQCLLNRMHSLVDQAGLRKHVQVASRRKQARTQCGPRRSEFEARSCTTGAINRDTVYRLGISLGSCAPLILWQASNDDCMAKCPVDTTDCSAVDTIQHPTRLLSPIMRRHPHGVS